MAENGEKDLLAWFYFNETSDFDNGSWEIGNTSGNASLSTEQPWQTIVTGFLLSLMILATFLGNALVIISVVLETKLRSFNNYFFASLAAADLILAISVMPLALLVQLNGGQWYYGKRLCDVFIFLDVSCCTASILNLCAISLNRYWSVTSPLKYATKQTSRRAAVMIAVVWTASFLIACPPMFGWPKRNADPFSCEHNQNYIYIIYSSFGSFYIPVLVLTVVYCKIYRISKRGAEFRRRASLGANVASSTKLMHLNNTNNSSSGNTNSPQFTSRPKTRRNEEDSKVLRLCKLRIANKTDPIKAAERKTAKTLALIMGAFFVCWLPFFVMYLVMPFCASCTIHPVLEGAIVWLGYCNSTLNPVIYICCKPQFRETFKKILCCYYVREKWNSGAKGRKLCGTVVARRYAPHDKLRFGGDPTRRHVQDGSRNNGSLELVCRKNVMFSRTQSSTEEKTAPKAVTSSTSEEAMNAAKKAVRTPSTTGEGDQLELSSLLQSDGTGRDDAIDSPTPGVMASSKDEKFRQKVLEVITSEVRKLEEDYVTIFESENTNTVELDITDISTDPYSELFDTVKDRDLEFLLVKSKTTNV